MKKSYKFKARSGTAAKRVVLGSVARGRQSIASSDISSQRLAIKSILVPTDFSGYSEKALAYAIPFARQIGATRTLLHVIEPIATADFQASFPLAIENEQAEEFCEGVLTQTAQKFKMGPKLLERKLVRFGRAFNEIVSAARTLKVDLIIIATHGYTGLKHTVMGSTAERVVRHAPCPVLVVRTQSRNPTVVAEQNSDRR